MASRTKGGKGAKGHGHDHHNHQTQSDVPEKMEQPLDEQELESLYAWVDSIPLSRPKRNIARDFSDGVQVAEIAHFFFPSYVEMHNYTPANNAGGKLANWNLLNKKVFGKMNFELAEDVINDLVCCKPGMIEKVLLMLQVKIKRAQYARQHQSDKPEADQHTSMSPGRKDGRTIKVGMDDTKGRLKTKQYSNFSGFTHQIEDYGHTITQHYLNNRGWSSGLQDQKPKPKKTGPVVIPKKRPGPIVESDSVPRYVVEEKEQEVLSRDETIQMLQNKVQKLEQLLTLKDMRISELTEKQYINSTSSNGPSNYGKHRNYNNPHQYGGYR